ncbi:MAG TPA: aspartate kinase [Planctomycetota bacterium]|nr:aspartate kinase [Planctomycetota bacterium]
MKFGGSSVENGSRMRLVADLVIAARAQQPCVVLSAMGKATDALFAAAKLAHGGSLDEAMATVAGIFARAETAADELLGPRDGAVAAACHAELGHMHEQLEVLLRGVSLLRELTPRTNDAIVTHGERIATTLFAAVLRHRDVAVTAIDARVVLRTDDRFGGAAPMRTAIRTLAGEHMAPLLAKGHVVVTQGYVGATANGSTTTLGRGGSDWSAALLGEALDASEVQIWTDVEGVLTADPRIVPRARPIEALSPAEAAELAAFGAKVLHPATIQPAVDAGIPVTVRHTLRPRGAFTTIDPRHHAVGRGGVAALAGRGPITVLTMTSTRMLAASGYLARLFAAFGDLGICIDLVATAEVSVACTVEPDAPIERLVEALAGLARVEVATNRAILCAIGEGLRSSPDALARACRAMQPITPELVSFGGNSRNLSFVVRQEEMATAMQRLHEEFFGDARPARGDATTTPTLSAEAPR